MKQFLMFLDFLDALGCLIKSIAIIFIFYELGKILWEVTWKLLDMPY